MNRLTEKRNNGRWGLKGVDWKQIAPGAKITDERQSKIDERLEKRFSDLSRDFLYGGQSAYDVIVGIV